MAVVELEAAAVVRRLLTNSEENRNDQQVVDFILDHEKPLNREEQADRETLWATKHC